MLRFADFTTLDWIDLALLVAGAALVPLAWRRHARGGRRDPLRGAPIRLNVLSPFWVWLALVGYLLAAIVAAGVSDVLPFDGPDELAALWRTIITANLTQVLVALIALAIAAQTFTPGMRGFGIGRRPLARDVRDAVAGWLVASLLCMVAGWLTEFVILRLDPMFKPPAHEVFAALNEPITPWVVRLIAIAGALVLAPLGEELLFRGIFQTGMHRATPLKSHSLRHRWVAIAATAMLFGLLHLNTPHHIPALVLLGLVMGYMYERTGSMVVPVLIHLLFNGKNLLWFHLSAPAG